MISWIQYVFSFCFAKLKLSWEERFENPPPKKSLFAHVYTIVDGILCEIQRPKDEEDRIHNTNGINHFYNANILREKSSLWLFISSCCAHNGW